MQKTSTNLFTLLALFGLFAVSIVIIMSAATARAAQATVDLGSASSFAVLSGTPNITDAGNTSVIDGDVGLSPASGAGIGLLCSQVSGVIYSVDASGPICRQNNAPRLVTAKNDLTTAYTDAASRTPLTTVPTELGGTTLVAGVYDSSSTTFDISAGAGALVLDGQGDPSSVFIFQAPFSGTGLNVGSASTVSLVNGAQACNVFWRVDTASIDTTADFVGTILALNSITVANGATIEGRLLARNGNVTLINDTITASVCAGNDTTEDATDDTTDDTTTVIPGLPNTGTSGGEYIVWGALSLLLASVATLSGYVLYKKRRI